MRLLNNFLSVILLRDDDALCCFVCPKNLKAKQKSKIGNFKCVLQGSQDVINIFCPPKCQDNIININYKIVIRSIDSALEHDHQIKPCAMHANAKEETNALIYTTVVDIIICM